LVYTRTLYRLIAYKNFLLNSIDKPLGGKAFSTERFMKTTQRLHQYVISLELQAPASPAEKTLWSYYQFLESKLDQKMVVLRDEYKNHLDTNVVRRNLLIKKERSF